MQTIDDIKYDQTIHSQLDNSTALLYETHGTSIAIRLDNAHLLKFIQPFNQILDCRNHINTNDRKQFTLFSDSENIQIWISTSQQKTPDNLHDIRVFCPNSDDKQYFASWASRFKQIKETFTYDELDRQLLLYGTEYLRKLFVHFKDDSSVINLLKRDYRQMCLALANCFTREAMKQDDHIQSSTQVV